MLEFRGRGTRGLLTRAPAQFVPAFDSDPQLLDPPRHVPQSPRPRCHTIRISRPVTSTTAPIGCDRVPRHKRGPGTSLVGWAESLSGESARIAAVVCWVVLLTQNEGLNAHPGSRLSSEPGGGGGEDQFNWHHHGELDASLCRLSPRGPAKASGTLFEAIPRGSGFLGSRASAASPPPPGPPSRARVPTVPTFHRCSADGPPAPLFVLESLFPMRCCVSCVTRCPVPLLYSLQCAAACIEGERERERQFQMLPLRNNGTICLPSPDDAVNKEAPGEEPLWRRSNWKQ